MRLVLLWLSANYEQFVRLHTQVISFLDSLVTKKVDYHIFDVVVVFHKNACSYYISK